MPQARSFGFIYADMPQSHSYVQWLKEQLEKNPEFGNIQIVFRKVPLVTGEHGDQQMAEAAEKHVKELDASVDVFLKPVDQMGTRRNFSEMVYRTASKPLIGVVKDDVMARWGATAVVYPSHDSIGKQAARMIRELFEGKAVAEILPEWPKEYGFAIDLTKARQFGLIVPVEILQMAGENIVK
jgi:putative ABC transport system substrate-binding protein